MRDTTKIFVVIALLCLGMGAAILLSTAVHWSLGFGGVAVLLMAIDFYNFAQKRKKVK